MVKKFSLCFGRGWWGDISNSVRWSQGGPKVEVIFCCVLKMRFRSFYLYNNPGTKMDLEFSKIKKNHWTFQMVLKMKVLIFLPFTSTTEQQINNGTFFQINKFIEWNKLILLWIKNFHIDQKKLKISVAELQACTFAFYFDDLAELNTSYSVLKFVKFMTIF